MNNKEKTRFVETVCKTHLKGDIVITDPCYLDDGMDEKDENGKWICWLDRVTKKSIPSMMSSTTIYGDWSCGVYDITETDNIEEAQEIGNFCADAGMVCVCLLSDVLKFNPKFEEFIKKHNWCVCVIKEFDGDILFNKYEQELEYDNKTIIDDFLNVEGCGTKNGKKFKFIGTQIGL